MKKLAICIPAYNEQKNIGNIIKKILDEKLECKIFICTEGSNDDTPNIVDSYQKKYPSMIIHISGQERLGKNHASSLMFKYLDGFEIVIYMDADINPKKHSLRILYNYLISNEKLNVVSPIFIADTSNLGILWKTIANLYTKSRIHAFTLKKYKFFSGRLYCIRKNILPDIPAGVSFDDFYFNLKIPYDSIDICDKAIAYYKRPSNLGDFVKYYIRIGKAFVTIKKRFPDLWKEQNKRFSVVSYVLFDLTNYKFRLFFFNLTLLEKIIFIFSHIIALTSMGIGFCMYKKNEFTWKELKSTKINYK